MTLAGASGLLVGAMIGPDPSPDAAWHERGRHIFIMVPSAVVTAIGVAAVARSQRTEALADQATTALVEGKNEADRFLYFQCVSARADWSGNRSEVARIQINMFKESLAATMTAQEAAAAAQVAATTAQRGATTAQTEAQSATSLANDAQGNALKAAQAASASADATRNLAAVTENVIGAMPKKDSDPALREAKAALAGVKKSVAPKPDSPPPPTPPPTPVPALQQQR